MQTFRRQEVHAGPQGGLCMVQVLTPCSTNDILALALCQVAGQLSEPELASSHGSCEPTWASLFEQPTQRLLVPCLEPLHPPWSWPLLLPPLWAPPWLCRLFIPNRITKVIHFTKSC